MSKNASARGENQRQTAGSIRADRPASSHKPNAGRASDPLENLIPYKVSGHG